MLARVTPVGHPLIATFTEADIGTEAMGWAVIEDHNHILHFGCNALVSFDGDHWKSDRAGGAYAIRGLDEGADGRIWACGVGEIGWFELDRFSRWQFHSLRGFLPPGEENIGEMWHAFGTASGAIFVSADEVLFWNGQGFKFLKLPGGRRLTALRVGREIYVDYLPMGLCRLAGEHLEVVIPASTLGSAAVFWMERRGLGWLLATSKGMFQGANGHISETMPGASDFIRANGLSAVLRLRDGRLALGSLQRGIMLLGKDGAVDGELTTSDGLPTNEIFALGADHDGGLWATSEACLCRVSLGAPVSLLDAASGLHLPCEAITRTAAGVALAMGTDVVMINDAIGTPFSVLRGQRHIWSLLNEREGLLVSGSFGVALAASGQVSDFIETSQDAFAMADARTPGHILVGVGRSVVEVERATGAQLVLTTSLPDLATSLAEDGHGTIWVGTTAAGLLEITPGAAGLPHQAGAGTPVVATVGNAAVTELADGRVGTLGLDSGYVISADGRHRVPVEGLPHLAIAACCASSDNQAIWTVYFGEHERDSVLGRILLRGDHATWAAYLVEGLNRIGTPTCVIESSAAGVPILWLGGAAGVLRVDLTRGAEGQTPFSPVISVFGRNGSGTEPYALQTGPIAYATNDLVVSIAIPSYDFRPSIECSTRIDGIDSHWIPLETSGERRLVALREGVYRLHTRAVLNGQDFGSTLALIILPPWWRTTTCEVASLGGLIGLVIGTNRFRLHAVRQRALVLETTVRNRTADLERAHAARAEFVANVTHDIRNPLNGIVGLTFALADSGPSEEQEKLIRAVRRCACFLETLAGDVLELAQIEGGRVVTSNTSYRPGQLLEEVAGLVATEADAAGATVTTEFGPHLPDAAVGDPAKIIQILVNYALNAVRYAGGRIVLSARPDPRDPAGIEYSVQDWGRGLTRDEQSIVFKRFGRLDRAATALPTGCGLGLSICEKLAALIGGTVGVESEPGRGARFFLRTAGGPAPDAVPGAFGPENRQRILLVEDADYNAWAIAAVLRRVGLAVVARAKSIAEAVEAYEHGRFNVILVDMELPDGPGTEVARRIRAANRQTGPTRIIAITGHSSIAHQVACRAAGMDGYIEKPITPEKISAAFALNRESQVELASGAAIARGRGFDDAMIRFLARGDAAKFRAEVKRYGAALEAEFGNCAAAAASGDPTVVGAAVHRLVAHAKFGGAEKLANAAAVFGQRIGTSSAPEAAVLWQTVEGAKAEVEKIITTLLAGSATD